MKKIILFFALFAYLNANAQDVIVMKDGSTILSKVIEVNKNDIKYKKTSNINGPTYTINISELISINYENGEKDVFDANNTPTEQPVNQISQLYIERPADYRNAELISFYNHFYEPTNVIGKSKKNAKRFLLIIGMKESSVISNDEIEIQMLTKKFDGPYYDYWCQMLNIVNKTDKTIYIDKGNCYRLSSDSQLYCYYDPSEQVTVSSGRSSGTTLGLGSVAGLLGLSGVAGQLAGGISLGGGHNSSVSTTYSQQRVIGIPANSSRSLTVDKWAAVDRTIMSNEQELMESMERFHFKKVKTSDIGFNPETIKVGDVLTFGENDLPWNRKYIITYSTNENFTTYSTLTADFYIREIIGVPRLMSVMKYRPSLGGLMEDELAIDTFVKGFNDYTIIGYHELENDKKSGAGLFFSGKR